MRSEGRLGISNKSFNKNSWYSLRVIALAFLENVKECTSNSQFPQYRGKGPSQRRIMLVTGYNWSKELRNLSRDELTKAR